MLKFRSALIYLTCFCFCFSFPDDFMVSRRVSDRDRGNCF
jgi:hypothetical protein